MVTIRLCMLLACSFMSFTVNSVIKFREQSWIKQNIEGHNYMQDVPVAFNFVSFYPMIRRDANYGRLCDMITITQGELQWASSVHWNEIICASVSNMWSWSDAMCDLLMSFIDVPNLVLLFWLVNKFCKCTMCMCVCSSTVWLVTVIDINRPPPLP